MVNHLTKAVWKCIGKGPGVQCATLTGTPQTLWWHVVCWGTLPDTRIVVGSMATALDPFGWTKWRVEEMRHRLRVVVMANGVTTNVVTAQTQECIVLHPLVPPYLQYLQNLPLVSCSTLHPLSILLIVHTIRKFVVLCIPSHFTHHIIPPVLLENFALLRTFSPPNWVTNGALLSQSCSAVLAPPYPPYLSYKSPVGL